MVYSMDQDGTHFCQFSDHRVTRSALVLLEYSNGRHRADLIEDLLAHSPETTHVLGWQGRTRYHGDVRRRRRAVVVQVSEGGQHPCRTPPRIPDSPRNHGRRTVKQS